MHEVVWGYPSHHPREGSGENSVVEDYAEQSVLGFDGWNCLFLGEGCYYMIGYTEEVAYHDVGDLYLR